MIPLQWILFHVYIKIFIIMDYLFNKVTILHYDKNNQGEHSYLNASVLPEYSLIRLIITRALSEYI